MNLAGGPWTSVHGLGERALKYAAALGSADEQFLAERLYSYNTAPVTRRWLSALPNDSAVQRFLGVQPGGHVLALLNSGWQPVISRGRRPDWSSWAAIGPAATGLDRRRPMRKIYVSPAPWASGEALAAAVAALHRAGHAVSLKFACTARGLLRPDKIVLYCADGPTLESVLGDLADPLYRTPPQGVPFTVRADPGRVVLSWGLDPPADGGAPQSWRSWIAARLAGALVEARRRGLDSGTAVSFAREQLSEAGVGAGWRPAARLWADS